MDTSNYNQKLKTLTIPSSEYSIKGKRDSGPGGQHRNKTSSAAELRFAINESKTLTPEQKETLVQALRRRVIFNKETNEIVLTVAGSRDFHTNAEGVIQKLHELLREKLAVKPPRKPTKISKAKKGKLKESQIKERKRKVERRKNKVKGKFPSDW